MDAPETTRIPIICGPTGSGKTAVALELAEKFNIEIVSADSRQIIKHLDIGTAKPTAAERERVSFHLLDVIEPGERYSAFRFIDDANRAIETIFASGHLPVVVGGTGLYLRALTDGVAEIDEDDMAIRERLEREMDELGADAMFQRLQKIDPLEAARIHPNNRVRIIRALEIFYLTSKTKSELVTTGAYRKSRYSFDYFCLMPERDSLYRIINERTDRMLAAGWLEEVKGLMEQGLGNQMEKANVIGYSELMRCLEGNLSMDEALSIIKQATRRYAKRQMTWFRNQLSGEFFRDRKGLYEAVSATLSANRI